MMRQDSLESAAIRFTLKGLQESARRSGYFSVIYVSYTTLPMQADSPPIRGGNQDLLYRPLEKI